MRVEDAFRVNLTRLMNERGLRPRRLAEKAEVSLTAIYEARRGRSTPTLVTGWKIARGLGVTLDDLLKGATE